MKVVYWTSVPSPYMVARFSRFAATTGHSFTVWFTDPTFSRHPWRLREGDWQFSYRYLHPEGRPSGLSALRALGADRPDLLVSLYASAEFLTVSQIAKTRGAVQHYFYERTQDEFAPRRLWKESVKRFALGTADAILVPGPDAASAAARYAAPNRITTLHHCVDRAGLVAPEQRHLERMRWRALQGWTGLVYLYVGALETRFKGLDVLLDAFARTAARLPDARLVLAGQGSGLAWLHERAQELAISDRIEVAGFVQPHEIGTWYAAADVFVFPSRGDTYGMVIDEAMASGLPVITTTNVGEASLRIDSGRSGFLVGPSDAQSLANCMVWLGESPERRRAFGREAEQAIAPFTTAAWASQFEAIVDTVAARRAAAR